MVEEFQVQKKTLEDQNKAVLKKFNDLHNKYLSLKDKNKDLL